MKTLINTTQKFSPIYVKRLCVLAIFIASQSMLFAFTFKVSPWSVTHEPIKNNIHETQPSTNTPLINTHVAGVELLNFNAIATGSVVELYWSTQTENNNDYFTVEKSHNGFNFEPSGMIKGAGNSTVLLDYFEVDYFPYEGISYYRLKLTDRNGHTSYSEIIPVNYQMDKKGLMVPVTRYDEDVDIDLTGVINEEVLVVLKNKDGLESYTKILVKKEGKNIIGIDGNNKLEPGAYIVLASSRNELYAQKIIVR